MSDEMDRAEALCLLEGSIEKWEAIVAGTGEDHGTDNCDLCAGFYALCCVGCPVAAKVGADSCEGTPYQEWSDHMFETHDGSEMKIAGCAECDRFAQAELDFLRSLLPDAETIARIKAEHPEPPRGGADLDEEIPI